ncbi:MAG: hypothetical protein ACYTEQ_21830 [Planctomycetota bacterium]
MSEEFYRRCWLQLKAEKPRLVKKMTEIELSVEGIHTVKLSPKKEDDKIRRV